MRSLSLIEGSVEEEEEETGVSPRKRHLDLCREEDEEINVVKEEEEVSSFDSECSGSIPSSLSSSPRDEKRRRKRKKGRRQRRCEKEENMESLGAERE